jgi:glycosyltransferase involved in cell wall biosynthesis
MPEITIILPTYNRSRFLPRAIDSLLAQTFTDWELWIVDDGSTDDTPLRLAELEALDARIHSLRLSSNQGLGGAVNAGLERAAGDFIGYLPDDDVYYREHLQSLADCLRANPSAALAYSGVRHHYNRTAPGAVDGYSLQPVQVLHRRTPDRWLERRELVTDDFERMIWEKLRARGDALATYQVTCEWVDHPDQLHKIVREPIGGINLYRTRFGVQHPLRFHTSVGNRMDEDRRYASFRERPDTPPAAGGLKIVLVGELAYNAERILALEEQGHKLYGLWMPDPYWYNYVGPLPFGHVTDLPRENWQQALRDLQPDVIYALLNWQAVPWALQVRRAAPEIPFVWHFKEGPFISLEKGHWADLLELYATADGLIYSSDEMRDWTETVLPGDLAAKPSLILDGDLPKRDWFAANTRRPLISETRADGEYHTVVPGRPIGLHPETVAELAENGIHLHFYGNFTHGQWLGWIEKTHRLAPGYLHLHDQVDQEHWAGEFSQYDAGWLHYFQSDNAGELRRANWDDLNIPARLATLALSGLPVLQRANPGAIVATQNLVSRLGIGLFFTSMKELREQLDDRPRMAALRERVWQQRDQFLFDTHAPGLVDFFRTVIAAKAGAITMGRAPAALPQEDTL